MLSDAPLKVLVLRTADDRVMFNYFPGTEQHAARMVLSLEKGVGQDVYSPRSDG